MTKLRYYDDAAPHVGYFVDSDDVVTIERLTNRGYILDDKETVATNQDDEILVDDKETVETKDDAETVADDEETVEEEAPEVEEKPKTRRKRRTVEK